MDEILTNVNKTPITTGILYDRIMPFSHLDWLKENGTITNSNYNHFIQSWSELYRSAYNPSFPSSETLKSNINSNINSTLVDIGVINTKINYIDYGTSTNPSLTITNGKLYNVSGINPFLEKQVSIIAPLKEKIISNTVTFRLLPTFILQQNGLTIKNLVANFSTGTNYNLITNSVISSINPIINFTTSGKKTFTFIITFNNNTTETLTAEMFVGVTILPTVVNNSTASFPLEEDFVDTNGITAASTSNIAFQGYNETSAIKGTLEYRTYYNKVTNNGSQASKIKKEIIILDGFDPGDGRKIYQQSVGYNVEDKSLYELMLYDDDYNSATEKINLVEKLRNAPYGFDVTLVNFPNGADYIERNAMALVALLQRENAKLTANGSTEKISIIGPSMGGLISRYALAYMKKNNMNHNTKLWVSFDSPHLGANIPIGAQENLYFYGYNGRQDQAKTKFDENFRSPAARQMLIEQLDNKHESFPYPTTLWGNNSPSGLNNNSPFRQQFQNSLNTNGLPNSDGYPQNLRKIALINGTTNGTKTNNSGQKFLELAAFTIIKYGQIFGTPIQTKIKVATMDDSFLQNTGGFGQTFSGKVTIKRVGGIEVQNGSATATNSNPRGCMDVVQGGTFNTQGIIKEEFTSALNDAVDSQEWRTYLPNHAFIPSVSALAFKNPNFDWATALNRNLVCDPLNKEIYFDTYFAPGKNEEHVFVSAENANWLIKELQGIPQAPSFPVSLNELAGPSIICTNATYSFSDICKIPSAATWSVSSNLQITSSNSLSVSLSAISNGEGTITATFQNGQTLTKTIWVGKPILTYEANCFEGELENSNCFSMCKTNYFEIQNQRSANAKGLDLTSNNSDWEWIKVTNNFAWTTNNNTANIQPYQAGFIAFKVRVKNICGWSNWLLYQIAVDDCSGAGNLQSIQAEQPNTYTIYPNPSNDIINIDLRDQNNKPNENTKVSGELFDIIGLSKAKVQIIDNKATFSVVGLNKGIYVLKIYINDQIENYQIAVE